MADDPLILSVNAARRLNLLRNQGAPLTPKLEAICASLSSTALLPPTPGDRHGTGGILLAGLLPSLPSPNDCDTPGCIYEDGCAGSRGGAPVPPEHDVLAELAASLPTLKSLKASHTLTHRLDL
jgi:hypothetical protein